MFYIRTAIDTVLVLSIYCSVEATLLYLEYMELSFYDHKHRPESYEMYPVEVLKPRIASKITVRAIIAGFRVQVKHTFD